MALSDDPQVLFEDAAAWEAWLADNHATARGVWIVMGKKGSGVASLSYAEAVEHALRYGWIDGQARRIDEAIYRQRFTPRGPRSVWSKINVAKALALIESGRMTEAGFRAVEAARADGRWERAYDPPSRATVPEDLQAALDARPGAAEFFAGLDSQNRYAVLHRIQLPKRPETRARRIAQLADMLARGEKLYP